MKILFLSRWLPYPPSNGSKLRIYNLLQGLAKNHQISLITFAALEEMGPVPAPLAEICEDTQILSWAPFDPLSSISRQGFLSSKPRSILDTYSPELGQAIKKVLNNASIDLVIASQIDMAAYSNFFDGYPAIFEEAELGVMYEKFARAPSIKGKIRFGLTWAKYRRYLRSILHDFEAITVVSDNEKAIFTSALSPTTPVYVIPNCVNVASYHNIQAVPSPGTMVFIGSLRFAPNHEGMKWFIQDVLPLIQREVSGAALYITGDHGDLPLPPGKHITRTGMLPDIRPQVAGSWLSVVPIWEGGGTRLKILESMAMRTPVVATSKGAEGLDAQNGKEILIADTAEMFAAHTISILKDPGLRTQIADQAYHLVNTSYNWETTIPHYEKLIASASERKTDPDPSAITVTTDS